MASRRAPPPTPERPKHTVQEKHEDIREIERRIAELDAFDVQTVTRRFSDPNVKALQTAIDETLSDVFGNGSEEYQRYAGAARLDNGPISMVSDWEGARGGYSQAAEAHNYLTEGKEGSLSLLRRAVSKLREEIERDERRAAYPPGAQTPTPVPQLNRKIFIVHGHDTSMLSEVARVVEKLGFEAVVLHEQPNKGRTLIEKFEDHGETAGFAIVLLSPDDFGRAKDSDVLAPRARQNVVLELGYFVGKAGRKRVCALVNGVIEIPSDIMGVVFEQFDPAGAWKMKLVGELLAADYDVDANRLWKS